METRINEVFSSIQGEGRLIGRRQIFIRFAGCNLNCNYCDTPQSRDPLSGDRFSADKLFEVVNGLITPDFHSVSLTGGEPLLHAEFIRSFIKKYPFDYLLETNGSLPMELSKIARLIKYASLDIKLPEHNSTPNWDDLFCHELESINILIDHAVSTYCKMVILPSTTLETVGFITSKIKKEVSDTTSINMVIQPAGPLNYWINKNTKLFRISERVGRDLDVLVIPQVHRFLGMR